MSKKAIVFSAVILLIVSISLAYLAIPRVSIALLAKAYDLNIFYRSVSFTPHINARGDGGFKVDIDLRDVRISKKGTIAGAYENLGALVSAPFDGSLKYREIKGVIRPRLGHIFIDALVADGGDIKVSLKGTFFYTEDRADLDVVMQFSKTLLKKIPQELSETVLRESPAAIEITGRLFKLSIKELSEN
ncbi:MAG: hypothetical protein NTZ95_06090 [Candidatus Omnitrophica bacterium]|nr:hypothetical protein [Candidatus Omnitrophota bacterium]